MSGLVEGVDGLADFIQSYAIGLVAVGSLAMAFMEAIKKSFGLTASFHRRAVVRWLSQEPAKPKGLQLIGGHYGVSVSEQVSHLSAFGDANAGAPASYDANAAYGELMQLVLGIRVRTEDMRAVGGGSRLHNAFFELELAKLMGQLQDAADAVLSNPASARQLFSFLTRGSTSDDLTAAMAEVPADEDDAALTKRAAAVARVRLLVRRQLDAFQTVTSYRWREWNQFVAVVLGMVVMYFALGMQPGDHAFSLLLGFDAETLKHVALSLAGGMLAPVAKDLVDALAVFKRGG